MRPSKVTTCAAPSHSISYLLVPDGAFPLPQQLQQQAGKEPGGQGAAGAAGSAPGRPLRPPRVHGLPRVTLSASHVRSYLDSCRDGSLSVNLSGLFFAGSSTVGPSTEAVAE